MSKRPAVKRRRQKMTTHTTLPSAMNTPIIEEKKHYEQSQTAPIQQQHQTTRPAGAGSEGLRSLQGVDPQRRGRQADHRRRTPANAPPGVQNQVVHPASRAWLKRRADRNNLLTPTPV